MKIDFTSSRKARKATTTTTVKIENSFPS